MSVTRDNASMMLEEFEAVVATQWGQMEEDRLHFWCKFKRKDVDVHCCAHIAVQAALKAIKSNPNKHRHHYQHEANRAILPEMSDLPSSRLDVLNTMNTADASVIPIYPVFANTVRNLNVKAALSKTHLSASTAKLLINSSPDYPLDENDHSRSDDSQSYSNYGSSHAHSSSGYVPHLITQMARDYVMKTSIENNLKLSSVNRKV